jgi:hypothetical protein
MDAVAALQKYYDPTYPLTNPQNVYASAHLKKQEKYLDHLEETSAPSGVSLEEVGNPPMAWGEQEQERASDPQEEALKEKFQGHPSAS